MGPCGGAGSLPRRGAELRCGEVGVAPLPVSLPMRQADRCDPESFALEVVPGPWHKIQGSSLSCVAGCPAQGRGLGMALASPQLHSLGQNKDTLPSPKTGWSYPAHSTGHALVWEWGAPRSTLQMELQPGLRHQPPPAELTHGVTSVAPLWGRKESQSPQAELPNPG